MTVPAAAHLGHHRPAKGVMLTHGNVTWNVINLLTSADFRSDDVTIALAPFFPGWAVPG